MLHLTIWFLSAPKRVDSQKSLSATKVPIWKPMTPPNTMEKARPNSFTTDVKLRTTSGSHRDSAMAENFECSRFCPRRILRSWCSLRFEDCCKNVWVLLLSDENSLLFKWIRSNLYGKKIC